MLSVSFNLLRDAWLPVRRLSGQISWIRPAELAGGTGDIVVDFAWGRPDFDAASREWMIGLIATALAPKDGDAFDELWSRPPDAVQLDRFFAPFASAFNLDGDGPRFMQDLDALESAELSPVSALLIEAPGANTIKENKDLFQKRGRVEQLSLPAAAIALFTLQTFAPTGGAGHRVSLRGGGPLTTLVAPADPAASLWQKLWLNVPNCTWKDPQPVLPLVFPWLAPTITSDGKPPRQVSLASAHDLQAFWGMPRRLRLNFEENAGSLPCPLTGLTGSHAATGFRTRPYGVMYTEFPHALSPYYRKNAKDTSWLAVHPQPGGIAYRDWPKLVSLPTPTTKPASCVATALSDRVPYLRERDDRQWGVTATGYDMDNMKARGFVETPLPVFLLKPERRQDPANLVASSEMIAGLTASSVRRALEGDHGDAKSTLYESLRERFYAETESHFYAMLARVEGGEAFDGMSWLKHLRNVALRLFDETVPIETLPHKLIDRGVNARASLTSVLAGFGKTGDALYATLGLPLPKPTPKAGKAERRQKPPGDNP
jgi:CRISPR system Cascade subunit CasA